MNQLLKDKHFAAFFGPVAQARAPAPAPVAAASPVVSVEDVMAISANWGSGQTRSGYLDGDKWVGGFGPTELLTADYWTLRARSSQLFETNLFARGLIRRLITNEINTGLNLEASPMEDVLGLEEGELEDWSEATENRFELWAKNPEACDALERQTFGQLQQEIRREAIVSGDVLVMLQQDQRTGLPRVRLVTGAKIRTPLTTVALSRGNRIAHGVELDAQGRHVAFWVEQDDLTSKRIPAWGEKSGRRLAWLVYGTDKRLDDVRGKPLLALMLQSLRDLDRYRDATLRKAVVNSILAMFVEKKEQLPSALPVTAGGAIKKGVLTDTGGDGKRRSWNVAESLPGLFIEELQAGETIKPGTVGGTDAQLGTFQDAVLAAIAMASEIPPEILQLKFASNYSASRAALNEFDAYLFRVRTGIGESVNSPIYVEWLLSSVLAGYIEAPGLLEAWRDYRKQHLFGAWVFSDWNGHIKASVDPLKMMNGYKVGLEIGAMTRDRMARESSGMKFTRVARKLRKENELLAEALEPLKRLEAPPSAGDPGEPPGNDEQPISDTEEEGNDDSMAD